MIINFGDFIDEASLVVVELIASVLLDDNDMNDVGLTMSSMFVEIFRLRNIANPRKWRASHYDS